jgi:hypothetical protein
VLKKSLFNRRERKERRESLIKLGVLSDLGGSKMALSALS